LCNQFNEITSIPARKVCQSFFRNALASTHQYCQNSIIDSAAALIRGASLSLTSIGRHLPGPARVKDKIKRVDRLLGNPLLHNDIPMIFKSLMNEARRYATRTIKIAAPLKFKHMDIIS